MKQLLILSGKGGTGKTTLASALIRLLELDKRRNVLGSAYADCDVDAPNLHLMIKDKQTPQKDKYYGMEKARIDPLSCQRCGQCYDHCRFGGIEQLLENDEVHGYSVIPYRCEGCGVCMALCPENAIDTISYEAGEMQLYSDDKDIFSTAQLKMGSGTTGMLVTEVKKRMLKGAAEKGFVDEHDEQTIAVIDGSPGIGCPVIASISGVDLILIVTEPSISGMSDMKRIVATSGIFGVQVTICINKYDMNEEITKDIEAYCASMGIEIVGRIPYDVNAPKAVNQGLTLIDYPCISSDSIKVLYEKLMPMLMKAGTEA